MEGCRLRPGAAHPPTPLLDPRVSVASLLPCLTWLPPFLAKVGKPSRSKHNALPSGSLQFRALSKEDHGEWECIATNVVTSITASTHLTVIGTGRGWEGCALGGGCLLCGPFSESGLGLAQLSCQLGLWAPMLPPLPKTLSPGP